MLDTKLSFDLNLLDPKARKRLRALLDILDAEQVELPHSLEVKSSLTCPKCGNDLWDYGKDVFDNHVKQCTGKPIYEAEKLLKTKIKEPASETGIMDPGLECPKCHDIYPNRRNLGQHRRHCDGTPRLAKMKARILHAQQQQQRTRRDKQETKESNESFYKTCPKCDKKCDPRGYVMHVRGCKGPLTATALNDAKPGEIVEVTIERHLNPPIDPKFTHVAVVKDGDPSRTGAITHTDIPPIRDQLAQAKTSLYEDCECGGRYLKTARELHLNSYSHKYGVNHRRDGPR